MCIVLLLHRDTFVAESHSAVCKLFWAPRQLWPEGVKLAPSFPRERFLGRGEVNVLIDPWQLLRRPTSSLTAASCRR
jgi:hypothetical protein